MNAFVPPSPLRGAAGSGARPPLLLIDGIGPFFRAARAGRINWSKIPFADLEADGRLDRTRFARHCRRSRR